MRMPAIITVHHTEPPPAVVNRVFMRMVVGAALGPSHILTDTHHASRNITDRTTYAEMRAHYWVWQNMQERPYVGFQHYRRSFLFPEFVKHEPLKLLADRKDPAIIVPLDDLFRYNMDLEHLGQTNPLRVLRMLEKVDAVVPPASSAPGGIAANYKTCHRERDWEAFAAIAPRYGLQIDAEMPTLRTCNCFILRWPLFLDYMQVWWSITEELWPRLEIEPGYQHRTIGFLSERIFTLWLAQQPNLVIRECPLLITT